MMSICVACGTPRLTGAFCESPLCLQMRTPISFLEIQLRASLKPGTPITATVGKKHTMPIGPQGWPDFVTFYMGRARNEGPVAMHGLPC